MDSARLYQSASALYTSYESTDVSAQGSENALSSFNSLFSSGEEETSENAGLFASSGTLADTFQMLSSQTTQALSESARDTQSEFQKLHELMIRHLYELLFGGHFHKIVDETDLSSDAVDLSGLTATPIADTYEIITTSFTSAGYYAESEETSFSAIGQVKTSDGRTIDIDINVSMSRSFASYYEKHFSSEKLQICDPLVINYDADLADLEDSYDFYFDLDTDGEQEKIARLTEGSGFLALDKNEDGIINDGSELFGPQSGDGFADLAAYDEDGNGWIDEGDSIFDQLKIWSKDPNGNDVLYTLKEKDIGAIYTGSADTQFSLNDMTNATLGYVRQTGIFLYEDGEAGTIQHVDLVS